MAIIRVETEPIADKDTFIRTASAISGMEPRTRGEIPRVKRHKGGILSIVCGRLTLKYVLEILTTKGVAVVLITVEEKHKGIKTLFTRSTSHEASLVAPISPGTLIDTQAREGTIFLSEQRRADIREALIRNEVTYAENLDQIDPIRAVAISLTVDYVVSMINSLGKLEIPLCPWHIISFVKNEDSEGPPLRLSLEKLDDKLDSSNPNYTLPRLKGAIWDVTHCLEQGKDLTFASKALDDRIIDTLQDNDAMAKLRSFIQEALIPSAASVQ